MKTIVLMGTSPSLKELDLSKLEGIETLGCNAITRMGFMPDHLVIADREVFTFERDNGNLQRYVDQGGDLLLSTTIWNPSIRCRDVPVQERPPLKFREFTQGVCSTPINFKSLNEKLCSFASVGGVILQVAVIMGAERIGMVGIDMKAPKDGSMHAYEEKSANEGRAAAVIRDDDETMGPRATEERFKEAKKMLGKRNIQVCNLSSWTGTLISGIFGNYSYDDFIKETKGEDHGRDASAEPDVC